VHRDNVLSCILHKGACSGTGKERLSHSARETDGSKYYRFLLFWHLLTATIRKVILVLIECAIRR